MLWRAVTICRQFEVSSDSWVKADSAAAGACSQDADFNKSCHSKKGTTIERSSFTFADITPATRGPKIVLTIKGPPDAPLSVLQSVIQTSD